MVNGVIAVIIAYLLGSIPSAYIVTRLLTGQDIRQLGGRKAGARKAGARNVYREVGLRVAIPVAIFDVGKGAAAVAIAHWWLAVPPLFVMAVGLAVVAGHMWSIYLKFSGGNGLSPTIGVLSLLMTRELVIVLCIMLILIFISRNPVLSLNISLLSLPISAWFLAKSGFYVIFVLLLLLIMVLNFLPTARAALAKAGSKENLLAELWRRNKAKAAEK